jgi:hypothetical protein
MKKSLAQFGLTTILLLGVTGCAAKNAVEVSTLTQALNEPATLLPPTSTAAPTETPVPTATEALWRMAPGWCISVTNRLL